MSCNVDVCLCECSVVVPVCAPKDTALLDHCPVAVARSHQLLGDGGWT